MENTNTEIAVFSEEVAIKKSQGWANVGRSIYTTEISLQNKAKDIIQSLIPPTNIEGCVEAEKVLKEAISNTVALETERKLVTGTLDAVTSRLMESEKKAKESVNNFKTAIIRVKQAHQKIQAEINAKADEISNIKLFLQTDLTNKISDIRNFISSTCNDMLQAALNTNISPFDIDDYVREKVASYPCELLKHRPPSVKLNLVSMIEYGALIKEHNWYDINNYHSEFEEAIGLKFSDYEVAFSNKELAIKKSKEEAIAKENELKAKADAEKLANQLKSVATPVVVQSGVKELKKSYKVDVEAMGNVPESAKYIVSCLFTNWKFIAPKIRTKDWFKLSVANMIVAIESYKNEDNLFEFSGVKFKEISKL